ncbi:MAG: hypothetical protein ACO1TE_14690 [Prosthecobacter sp.]
MSVAGGEGERYSTASSGAKGQKYTTTSDTGTEGLPTKKKQSSGANDVQLWTTQEENGAPSIAYLVDANSLTADLVPCLRIRTEIQKKDLDQKGIAVGKPFAHLEIGYCHRGQLAGCSVKISAKQTARQNWLAAIWNKVIFRLAKKSMVTHNEGAFTLIDTLPLDAVDKNNAVRLIMMMHSEFWKRGLHPDEAKKSDIDAFGLVAPSSRSAFGSKFRRMGFSVSCEG